MSHSIRNFLDSVPNLGSRVFIDPQSTVIGQVTIGDDSSVWPMAVIRGDVNAITIGKSCSIQDGAILHVTHDGPYTPGGEALVLGNGVTVAHKVVLHGCKIEDYCLIGMGALILDGAYLEHHVMVGAGSLVPPGKRLKSGYLYLGNPVKEIRPLTSEEIERLEYSAHHYVRLKDHYLKSIPAF